MRIYGNGIERVVRTNNTGVGSAAGRAVKLRLVMKGTDLYSIRFRE